MLKDIFKQLPFYQSKLCLKVSPESLLLPEQRPASSELHLTTWTFERLSNLHLHISHVLFSIAGSTF